MTQFVLAKSLQRVFAPAACAGALGMIAFTPSAAAESLLFASDVHNEIAKLQNVVNAYDDYAFGLIGLVGDYGAAEHIVDSEWQNTWGVLWWETMAEPMMVEGNHDHVSSHDYHYWTHGSGSWTQYGSNYEMYVINEPDFSGEAWYLEDFFANYQDHQVVIIMSHYPLHSARPGLDTAAAQNIFNVLQKYGDRYDIVYFWGHNHQRTQSAPNYDEGVNYVARPGETIGGTNTVISAVSTATLKFTYLNAGYILPKYGTSSPRYTILDIDDSTVNISRLKKGSGAPEADMPAEALTRKTCGNSSCESGEDACNCYEDCGWASGTCAAPGSGGDRCYCDDVCQNPSNADCCQNMIAAQGCF